MDKFAQSILEEKQAFARFDELEAKRLRTFEEEKERLQLRNEIESQFFGSKLLLLRAWVLTDHIWLYGIKKWNRWFGFLVPLCTASTSSHSSNQIPDESTPTILPQTPRAGEAENTLFSSSVPNGFAQSSTTSPSSRDQLVRAFRKTPRTSSSRSRSVGSLKVSSPLLLVGVATLSGIAIAAIRRRRHFSQEAQSDA